MSSWQGPPVLVGERALWLGSGSGLPKAGIVRWIGRLPEIGPDWTVGLELNTECAILRSVIARQNVLTDTQDEALPVGGIDGSWGGRVLFNCQPKHGLLVPISNIIPGSKLKHIPHVPRFEKNENEQEKIAISPPIRLRKSPPVESAVSIPKPAVRHKRRIPTPPSSDCDEPSGPVVVSHSSSDNTTLRVEERDQEDSLKKRLRLFTENNGALQRMKNYNECAFEEVVIDSLYAQRRQQFFKHGRSQSDSSHGFVSSASSPGSRRDRSSSAIFSIFRWFRKESRSDDFDLEFAPSAPPSPQLIRGHSTSCGSVDTLFSTATANSFAFVHPAYYRPFGAANPPEKCIIPGPETDTYRNRLRQRDRVRELDRNLTLKKKYHLFGSGTLHRSVDDVNNRQLFLNKSLDSLKVNHVSSASSKNSTLGRKKRKAPPPPVTPEDKSKTSLPSEQDKENTGVNSTSNTSPLAGVVVRRHRRTVSDSAKDRKSGAFVHVRGKRKAPPPPIVNNIEEKSSGQEVLGTQSLGRKKRHAPPPPLVINGKENEKSSGSPGVLSAEEKQRLIDNINKLQAHAERKSLLVVTPPASPVMNTKVSQAVCNDSLKLEKGVLKANKTEVQSSEAKPVTPTTPTPVSPRPWYKRNSGNKEKSLEKKKEKIVDDWMPEVAIARKNTINRESNVICSTTSSSNGNSYRLSSIFSRFDKPEEKRKSQISMLANISELDREAAEIVQREQEKERAMLAAQDAKYYTSSVEVLGNNEGTSTSMEMLHADDTIQNDPDSPKRSGARELISLFNAIGNVTKVTVHSAFFSKEGPSIFSKEGVEKRFSMSGDGLKSSEERVVKESITKSNGYKRETVFVETKECYSESPGVKRRRNLIHQDSNDSTASESSGGMSPRVVIEEIDDSEKSKTQALYEANKVRKHHSPSPSIPTIVEMSESISSVTASPGSTINASERSASNTQTAAVSEPSIVTENNSVGPSGSVGLHQSADILKRQSVSTSKTVEETGTKLAVKNYSIWPCPRCTLENPRWRVTCEACDMWRPAVRRDVIDKLTNANMGSTIAVNLVKAGDAKSTSAIKNLLPQVEAVAAPKSDTSLPKNDTSSPKNVTPSPKNVTPSPKNTTGSSLPAGTEVHQSKAPSVNTTSLGTSGSVITKSSILKPITVSGLLNGSCYEPKESKITDVKDIKDLKVNTKDKESNSNSGISGVKSKSGKTSQVISDKQNLPVSSVAQKKTDSKESLAPVNSSDLGATSSVGTESASDMEEVRKARLAFFQKSLSDKTTDSKNNAAEDSTGGASINNTKIEALFSIASKGSLATNEEERLKIKELLKEMKNSLPKKSRENKHEAGSSKVNTKTEVNVVEKERSASSATNSSSTSDAAARLGAIKKSKAHVSQLPTNTKDSDKTAEVYLVKSETIIEEIKVKENVKSPKVSTSVQTSGVVRKMEPNPTSPMHNEELPKLIAGKPPTPKSARKEVTVPVTVEEHVLKDGGVVSTVSHEKRQMGVGAFNLIRPRDFANIKATKTGNEVKPLHVYVNVPRTLDDDSSSSSSSSDSPEVAQLSAELTKPKGLADFKASVLEHGAGSKMNTLAVNRLLRQLEAAITGGQHMRAATLAKQLARHKVNCCVTRHKPADAFTVDVFVEDKMTHQGPYHVQVSPSMTVAQLKAKVEDQFEIPVTVQRWILGKQLATDDRATLEQLGVTQQHCPVFLYLVAPDAEPVRESAAAVRTGTEGVTSALQPQSEEAGAAAAQPAGRGWYFNEEADRYSFCESEVTDLSSKDASPEPSGLTPQLPEPTPVLRRSDVVIFAGREHSEETGDQRREEEPTESGATGAAAPVVGTLTVGWKCTKCTLINSPTRPGCSACGTARPVEYQVPNDHVVGADEQRRLHEEQVAEEAAADEKLKNYHELVGLENADLIPSTEAFECSVCLTECAAGDGVVLRDCLHSFCRVCLAHTIQFTEDAEVKCPFRDHQYACDSTLQDREIKAVSEEEDDSCIICMAEPRCCALTPCGHRAYCETCCLRLIELDQMCSLCRRKADGYLIIYL